MFLSEEVSYIWVYTHNVAFLGEKTSMPMVCLRIEKTDLIFRCTMWLLKECLVTVPEVPPLLEQHTLPAL